MAQLPGTINRGWHEERKQEYVFRRIHGTRHRYYSNGHTHTAILDSSTTTTINQVSTGSVSLVVVQFYPVRTLYRGNFFCVDAPRLTMKAISLDDCTLTGLTECLRFNNFPGREILHPIILHRDQTTPGGHTETKQIHAQERYYRPETPPPCFVFHHV